MNYSVFNEFRIIIDHYCSSPHVELPAAIFICAKLALKSLTVNRASDLITGLGNSRCLDICQIYLPSSGSNLGRSDSGKRNLDQIRSVKNICNGPVALKRGVHRMGVRHRYDRYVRVWFRHLGTGYAKIDQISVDV